MNAPTVHLIEVFSATVLDSDYTSRVGDRVGAKVYVARCSCGWSAARQFEHATRNQAAKHRTAVTS